MSKPPIPSASVAQCFRSIALSGTLVVVIPSREGLVIAADSRSTVDGQYFDGVVKLHVTQTQRPIVVAVTGTANFIDAPPKGISLEDWFPKATYRYRGTSFAQAYLNQRPDTVLSASVVSAVAAAFATSLGEGLDADPSKKAHFAGQELCRVVLAQTESDGSMRYASVPLNVDSGGRVIPGTPVFEVYRANDERTMHYLGESRYTAEHVLGPNGRRLLDSRAAHLMNAARGISDLSASDACFIAVAIIRAAEATTCLVPIPSGNGIGGKPNAYLITSERVVSLSTDVSPQGGEPR